MLNNWESFSFIINCMAVESPDGIVCGRPNRVRVAYNDHRCIVLIYIQAVLKHTGITLNCAQSARTTRADPLRALMCG